MNEKCAIYIRVSSDLQDYERQITDLGNFAKANNLNYSNENLYEDRLSGFKNENERDGLKKLLNEVVPSGIKFILIWEISRLARKHKDLLDITDFFQQNGIDVYFFQQRFWLLDETLKISPQAGLSIAFFGWQAEYEARLTKERFKSAKMLNESLGKYNGGKIPFGYKLDEFNKYVINENKIDGLEVSEADIVREVFGLYEKGLVCSKICMICRSKGYTKNVSNTHTLARLLRNTSYIGRKDTKLGQRPTPPIINEAQFYAVNKLITQNKTKADKGQKHIFLLRGILKCSVCENYYVGKQTDDAYICPQNSGSNKTNNKTSCKGGNISISNIEGIVWERVKFWLTKWKVDGFDDENKEYKSKILDINEQINRYKSIIQDIDKQKGRLNFIFKEGGCSPEEYQKDLAKNIGEREKYNKEISLLQSEINQQERRQEEYTSMGQRINNINSISDRNQMKKLTKNIIKEVFFYKVDLYKTVLFIQYYRISTIDCILYNSVAKKGNYFKLTYTKYIRYDTASQIFYVLKDLQSVSKFTSTKILKENGIGDNLPEYISLYDFTQLTIKHKRPDIKISNVIDLPIPDSTNSLLLTFDKLMSINEEIDGILTTHEYNKIDYFKNLIQSRFHRKKRAK